jgi:hypothetical protein
MLERIENLPAGVAGVRAKGRVTRDDYDRVIGPMLEQARQEGRRLHFLYQLGSDLEGFTAFEALHDAQTGLRYLSQFERCAVVSSVAWIQTSGGLAGAVLPCQVRVYPEADLERAAEWLAEATVDRNLSHQLLVELGTLVIEPTGRLDAHDFEALAATVDPWLRDHGKLKGLVVRARRFPEWPGFWDFLGHLRFVHSHRATVRRVALVSDVRLARLSQKLGERFARAQVAQFSYDQLEQAPPSAAPSVAGGAKPVA